MKRDRAGFGRCLAIVVALGATITLSAPAAAQSLFFDWGGLTQSGTSGRQSVSFPVRYAPGQIIVSFGDRKLYHVTARGQATSYPVAVPRERFRWQGVTRVSSKRENPSWTPTARMRRENPQLPAFVPGGHPQNPLGVRALYLGSSLYRIHGTDAPWTIGGAESSGCVRMFNDDVVHLYSRVSVGTLVTVTYRRYSSDPVVASSYGGSGGGQSQNSSFNVETVFNSIFN